MKNPTIEAGDGENLKGKNRKVSFDKVRKATTLKKGVVKKSELPNFRDESLVMKAN